jgi:hypothetical protein
MKLYKLLFLKSLLLVSCSAFSAEQIITPSPASQEAGQSASVSIDANYSTANPVNETLSGVGVRIHWDSSKLTFVDLANVFATNLFVTGAPESDASDFDSDANTDMFVNVAWLTFSPAWPGDGTTPLRLYTANFTTAAGFTGSTSINFSGSQVENGWTFESTSATVNELSANVSVPDVVGQTQSAAETAVTNAGLSVGNVTQQNSDTVPSGSVISQNPAAGTSVAPGSSVDLVVSSGSATVGESQVQPIPTLSEWAMILLTFVMGLVGLRSISRRQMH